MQITDIQSCALLCIRRHEDDPLASHRRLRIQTCRPDNAAILNTWQDKAAESIHDDFSAKACSQW